MGNIKFVKAFGSLAAAALLLYLVARSADWSSTTAAMARVHPGWLAFAAVIVICQLAVKGLRLAALTLGSHADAFACARAVALCLGINSFVPLRAGEVVKAVYVSQKTAAGLVPAALAVVAERLLDFAAVAVIAALALIFERALFAAWIARLAESGGGPGFAFAAAMLAALAAALGGVTAWKRDWFGVRSKFREKQERILNLLSDLGRTGSKRLALGGAYTALAWSADTLLLWSLAGGFGLAPSLTQVFFLQLVLTATYVSSVTPGALGLYEWLGLWALRQMGFEETPSLAFLLTAHGTVFAVFGLSTLAILIGDAYFTRPREGSGRK